MSKVRSDASSRIDEAIAQAEPFAQKILIKLRGIILKADARLVEDWKWGPCFHYRGNVVGIWGHKKHVNLIFWKGAGMDDPDSLFTDGDSPKALRTVKYFDVKEVDARIVTKYVKNAMTVVASGQTVKAKKVEIDMPELFQAELNKKKNKKLKAYYEALSYSHRKEFAHHIGEAKREDTKLRRLEKVMNLLERQEGLHDKYR